MYKHYADRALRSLLVLAIIIFGFFVFYYVSTLAYPFIIALIIALMINPLVNTLQHKLHLPRSFAVIGALLLILGTFIGLITLLVAEILSGTEYLAIALPPTIDKLITFVENFLTSQIIPLYNQLNSLFNNLNSGQQETIIINIKNIGSQIGSTLVGFITSFLQSIPNLIAWLPNAATVIIFSLLATFFISNDWHRLRYLSGKLIPTKAQASGRTVFYDLRRALFGFLKAQLTLISITTIIVLIGLLILKVEYAITISLIIGLVDLLPYLGTGFVFVPWIIYMFATHQTSFGIGLLVLYAVVIVQRQLMEPKILSSSIGLDPLATLVSLFVGFKLFGFLGLIIGPVILVVIKTLYTANVFHDIWSFIKGKPKSIQ